ncbi:MAG: Uma2 family endonuclease [Anaerolineae bacterium]|nr:Uma2 family endonuclease [Anaerolineae bacterium]MDW8099306.1 Uma2 family endonuclease [Anaerolineae bacterium]
MGKLRDRLLAVLQGPPMSEDELRRCLLEMAISPAQPRKITYEEFLAWADEDTWAEWVDGEVIMVSPASRLHQELAFFLGRVIGLYADLYALGKVLLPPFQMKLARSGREPDLIFIASQNLERLREAYLDGPADLVVEIVSPESIGRDRGEKFYEYEQAHIPEYWLVDPEVRRAEFYQLGVDGLFHLVPPDSEGIYRSASLPGFWIRVSWLWQNPLPMVEDVLLEIGGEAYARRWIERLRKRGFLLNR